MRVLCTCVPAVGRLGVVAPLARELAEAGHEVAFAVAESFRTIVEDAGFRSFPAGRSLGERRAAAGAGEELERMPPDRLAARMFARLAPMALLEDLPRQVRAWQSDLLLHEEGEFGAPLVADLTGLPNVAVGWPAPARPSEPLRRLDASLARLWTRAGRTPTRLGGVRRHLWLDQCPPTLQALQGLPPNRRLMQPVLWSPPGWGSTSWTPDADDDRPLVHVTFGTVPPYNRAPGVLEPVMEGLGHEPVRILLSAGSDTPASIGHADERAQVVSYVPHDELLPHCAVVVSHGGAGTTVAALSHGVPLLITPLGGASQLRNAIACAEAGVGRHLPASLLTPDRVRAEVRKLLTEPSYRRRARSVAEEIRAMPSPKAVVALVERAAQRKRAPSD